MRDGHTRHEQSVFETAAEAGWPPGTDEAIVEQIRQMLPEATGPVRALSSLPEHSALRGWVDGDTVYFTRIENGVPSVWRVAALGGPARKVVERGRMPVPSPDGRSMAYLTWPPPSDLVVAALDGSAARVLQRQVPAGIGFSQRLYELHENLVAQAAGLVTGCACTDGCPSCVGPGGENGLGGKKETMAILDALSSTIEDNHERY